MVVVLTLDHPHRKTQDVILKLLARGIKPMVVATEWIERKNFVPLIAHRPSGAMDISLPDLCNNLGLDLMVSTKKDLESDLNRIGDRIQCILLTTGSIIEGNIANRYKVINSHPGYLPVIKGLDALKWAILYKEEIGVTTHFIDGSVDGGLMIERKLVPLYHEDTFHSFAYRQYELEVDMLIDSINKEPENIEVGESAYPTFRRMPHRLEYRMLEKFEELKRELSFDAK